MGCCGKGDNKVSPDDEEDDFDGPLHNRSCRDVIFLIIFIAFMGGMGYVGYRGIVMGDPYRLLYGVDSYGNVCNMKNTHIENVTLSGRDMTSKPFQFYFNFAAAGSSLISSTVLCVERCPNETLLTPSQARSFAETSGSKVCRYDVHPVNYTADDKCPSFPILPHLSVLSRCIPQTILTAGQSILTSFTNTLNMIDTDLVQKLSNDVERTWKEILYLCAIAFGLSFLVTILLRFLAALMIWFMVVGVALGAMGGTGYLWYIWYQTKQTLDALPVANQTTVDQENYRNWSIYTGCATAATVLVLLILLIMRSRIALVVQLFREAGKAIGKMPLMLLQPFWTLIFLSATLGGLIFLFLYLETASQPVLNPDTGYVTYETDKVLFYMKWYHIFGILWLTEFIIACQQIVIAGSVASWYFTRDKTKLGWPILASTGRLMRYHLGSIAFGSFIIAVIRLIRLILAYVQKKLHGGSGATVEFMLKCLQCCLWCFEKFMKFLNRNAYIMIAIYGHNFCKAAQRALVLLVANALRVAAINSLGWFCLLLGKFMSVAAVAAVGFVFFKDRTDINYIWAPITLACIFAFFIAHCFLMVYDMTIDTIFLCFAEDCERNDGIEKPYYMSKGLMEYVDNSKAAMAAMAERSKARVAKQQQPKQTPSSSGGQTRNGPKEVDW